MRLASLGSVLGLVSGLVGAAVAQSDFSRGEGQGDPHRGRPDMTTVEEAAQIEHTRVVVIYPRLVTIIQYGWAELSSDAISRSFDAITEGLGLGGAARLPGNFQLFDFELRLDIDYRWRLAAGGVLGGVDSDAIDPFRRYGISLAVALTPEHVRGACLSAGVGIASSQIEYFKEYNQRLGDSEYYLFDIRWRSTRRMVLPVQVMLELPNLRYSHGGLVLAVAYQIGPEDKETMVLQNGTDVIDVPMEVNLSGWFLSMGLAIGF